MLQRIIIGSLLAAVLFAGAAAPALQSSPAVKPAPQTPAPLTAVKIRDDLYFFKGGVVANTALIKAMVASGKSLAEVRKAFGIGEPPAGGRSWPSLVEVIYRDLTEKRF